MHHFVIKQASIKLPHWFDLIEYYILLKVQYSIQRMLKCNLFRLWYTEKYLNGSVPDLDNCCNANIHRMKFMRVFEFVGSKQILFTLFFFFIFLFQLLFWELAKFLKCAPCSLNIGQFRALLQMPNIKIWFGKETI